MALKIVFLGRRSTPPPSGRICGFSELKFYQKILHDLKTKTKCSESVSWKIHSKINHVITKKQKKLKIEILVEKNGILDFRSEFELDSGVLFTQTNS